MPYLGVIMNPLLQPYRKRPLLQPNQPYKKIWSEQLGLEHVGLHENFFEIGGQSLLATRIVGAIQNRLSLDVSIKDIFLAPTVAEQAKIAKPFAEEITDLKLTKQNLASQSLSFSQHRLWLLKQIEGSSKLYNLHRCLKLKGKLHKDKFTAAFDYLLQRHAALRTGFITVANRPTQFIANQISWQPHWQEGNASDISSWQQQQMCFEFDFATPPLLRVAVLELAADEYLVHINLPPYCC